MLIRKLLFASMCLATLAASSPASAAITGRQIGDALKASGFTPVTELPNGLVLENEAGRRLGLAIAEDSVTLLHEWTGRTPTMGHLQAWNRTEVVDATVDGGDVFLVRTVSLSAEPSDFRRAMQELDGAIERFADPLIEEYHQPASVTMFGAKWCGACQHARAWFMSNGIRYDEIDLESDPTAVGRLARTLEARGVDSSSLSSYPIIIIGDHVYEGFGPAALGRALGIR